VKMSDARLEFYAKSARTKGDQLHTSLQVTGGSLDPSVVEELNNVTLVNEGSGEYTLIIEGATTHDRTVRNLQVYNALIKRFRVGDSRVFDRLVQEDQAKNT
jgi:hypothetical protein